MVGRGEVLGDATAVMPLVIHSCNVQRPTWMAGEFDLGGWQY